MVNFKEKYHFQGSGGGTNFSGGGGPTFSRGGVHCLFPIEPHITCDFPWGVRTPCPPLDPHLAAIYLVSKSSQVKILFWTPNRGMRIQHTIK